MKPVINYTLGALVSLGWGIGLAWMNWPTEFENPSKFKTVRSFHITTHESQISQGTWDKQDEQDWEQREKNREQNRNHQNENRALNPNQERGGKLQQDDQAKTANPKSRIPRPVKVYMGRRIAETMHFTGAEWLIRNEREREERCSLMLANLRIKPGQTVCDMGCGNGFYSLQIAKMMGDNGTVVGVDVQPEMLELLRKRMESEGVENIIPILGSFHHPRLPPGLIDLCLMVDVYHEFSHPEPMLAEIRKSLKPDGQIVLVEYRAEDKNVPIKPLHKMSKKQINREMKANGFKLNSEFDQLPWQHMMFFGIDPDWKPGE